MDNPD